MMVAQVTFKFPIKSWDGSAKKSDVNLLALKSKTFKI